jgi:hypothetical protein
MKAKDNTGKCKYITKQDDDKKGEECMKADHEETCNLLPVLDKYEPFKVTPTNKRTYEDVEKNIKGD